MAELRTMGPPLVPAQLGLPLRLSLLYVGGTLIIYLLGPYALEDDHGWLVTAFMVAVMVAFTLGYRAGQHQTAGQRMIHFDVAREALPARAANRIVIVGALWFLSFSLASLQRVGITNPLELIRAIANPQGSYYAKFDALTGGDGNAVFRALNLAGVFYFLLAPYLLLYWHVLRGWVRALAIVSLTMYLLFYLSIGTQKGVADMLIMFFACVLPLQLLRRGSSGRADGSLLGRRTWLALGGIGLAGVLIMATSLGLRTDATSSFLQDPQARAIYEVLARVFGDVLGRGIVLLLGYISQGYHGLALALQLPFIPAGGLGAYKALWSYLPQYFGLPSPDNLTYPFRVEEAFGWSATGSWSSVYPWYASDVSFAGVVLMAMVFGFFLARIWRRLMLECDGLSLSVFVTCVILVLYSPANNQLFNERLAALGVITLIGAYLVRELAIYRSGRSKGGAS